MNLYSIKKEKNHFLVKFLFIKFKFKIKLKKKYSHPVLVIYSLYGMGDYTLQRRFFKYIKQSPKYKNSSVILVCRTTYSDFAKTYDSQYFDEIIEVDLCKIENNIYRNGIVKKINSFEPDDLYFISCINMLTVNLKHDIFSNLFYRLCKDVKAQNKYISYYGDNPDLKNDVFNHLLFYGDNEAAVFEEDRLRFEFQNLLKIDIPVEDIGIKTPLETEKKRIAISLFATDKDRMLKINAWRKIINFITENTDDSYEIVFLGSKAEARYINALIKNINSPERCINMGGKLNTSLIPIILKSCEFLISVESGNVHIAHEVGCKTICISGSLAYGRFHPYKDNLIDYVYPEKFVEYLDKIFKENNVYSPPQEHFYVQDVDVNNVVKAIKKLI